MKWLNVIPKWSLTASYLFDYLIGMDILLTDRVKSLIQIEQSYRHDINPDAACKDYIRSAILGEINYDLYMSGSKQFQDYDSLLAYLITSKQL